jgi:hypothetical protein
VQNALLRNLIFRVLSGYTLNVGLNLLRIFTVRVQLEVCTDSSVEVYTQEAVKAKEYTDKDIDEIVKTITFGKTVSDQERNQLEEVVRKNVKAFSRSKGDLGFTTLIEHEIDLLHETPVKMKPYKLSFEE